MHIEWRLYGKPGVSSVPIPASRISPNRPVSQILILRPGCSEPAIGDLYLPATGAIYQAGELKRRSATFRQEVVMEYRS